LIHPGPYPCGARTLRGEGGARIFFFTGPAAEPPFLETSPEARLPKKSIIFLDMPFALPVLAHLAVLDAGAVRSTRRRSVISRTCTLSSYRD